MILEINSDIIFNNINELKKNTGFISNFFWSKKWIDTEIQNEKILIERFVDTFFLLNKKDCFYVLYFFSKNIDSLSNEVKLLTLPNSVVVIEIIEKNNSMKDVINLFTNNRFKKYSKLTRVSNTLKPMSYVKVFPKDIEYATLDDIQDIIQLHSAHFNKYVDRHFSYDELAILVDKHNILVAKQNNIIVGFFIFEATIGISHFRSAYISKTSKDMSLGASLFLTVFEICKKSKLVYAWLREDNLKLFQFYKSFKFRFDGLTDTILYYDTPDNRIDPLIPLN